MTAPGGVAPDRLPLPLPRAARARPHHPAVVAGDGVALTYAELAERADDVACRLAAAGVTAGDRVAVLVGDGARFAVLLHATARLGAVLVPLSTRLTAGELGWQVGDARPRLVVADPPRSAAAPGTLVLSWQALSDLAAADAPLVDDVRLDAPATMIYTSGTTGRPKGAVLTFGNLAWSAAASALRLGLLPGDRWLVPLPLFHVGGLAVLWRAALAATTVIAPGHFDAAGVAAAIAGGGATLVSLVPTMLARVLGAWGDRPPPAGLRAVLLGGGPAAPALVDRAIRLGFPIALTYGLTEAASQVATDWPRRDPADVDGGAPPLAFTEVRVVGADGAPLLVGEDGAIEVRGPTVMAGYWGDPDATARALAGGWLATGDIGRLDAAGRLHVRGRREDLIVTGGENVYPAEVEAVLAGHPAVGACCVVGIPDSEWGEAVAAAIVRAPGAAARQDWPPVAEGGAAGASDAPPSGETVAHVTSRPPPSGDAVAVGTSGDGSSSGAGSDIAAELIAFLRARLAGYKVPRRLVWLDVLPATAAGKVRRDEVRRLVMEIAAPPTAPARQAGGGHRPAG